MSHTYTEAEVVDVKEREEKALAMLKELQLSPAVQMNMVNLGNDSFGIKPYPFLQDLKFVDQISPIQKEDL